MSLRLPGHLVSTGPLVKSVGEIEQVLSFLESLQDTLRVNKTRMRDGDVPSSTDRHHTIVVVDNCTATLAAALEFYSTDLSPNGSSTW